jgi:hypothetical protein
MSSLNEGMIMIILRGLHMMSTDRPKLKRAELTAALGVLAAGIGLGALAGASLHGWGELLVLIGVAVHGWAMYDKRRLEAVAPSEQLWWEGPLYWLCWALLGLAAVIATMRVLG